MRFLKTLTIILGSALFQNAVSAQTISSNEISVAPMVTVSVVEGKTSVKEGEQVVLKVKGNDELSVMQWQVSLDGVNWQDIPKATGNNFETQPIKQMHYFRVMCRPIEATNEDIVTISNIQAITMEDNVASKKGKSN